MTITKVVPKGISGQKRNLLTVLNAKLNGPFTAREAAIELGYTVEGARRFLAYLAERGWLVRVSRGLYATVPLDTFEPSEWRIDPWVVASKLYGPSYYIGGWTACECWELTDQLFNSTVVFTTRRIRDKEVEVQGLTMRLARTNHGKIFGTKALWRDNTRVEVSDASRTVVDILNSPMLGGGIDHVANVLVAYFESEWRDDVALERYIRRLGNRAVFKRLGYLLEFLEVKADSLLASCYEGKSAGIALLDPDSPPSGPTLRRWNVRLNATGLL